MCRLLLSYALCLIVVLPVFAQGNTDEELLRRAGLKTDGPALVEYLTRQVENHRRLADLVRQLGHERFIVREKATWAIIELGAPATDALQAAVKDSDPEIAARAKFCLEQISGKPNMLPAVVRLLAVKKPEDAVRALLAYLPCTGNETSQKAICSALAAMAVRDGKADAALVAALSDKAPLTRGIAAEALMQAKASDQQAAVRKLLHDKDAGVRLRVGLALLMQARDKAAVPALIELLAELPPHQVWQVETALRQLAGKEAQPRPVPGDAKAYRDAWAGWWKQHAGRIDLAKVDFYPYPPGDQVLKRHQDTVHCVAFSPDGRLLASASKDKTVRLWDIVAGTEVRQFQGHQNRVRCVVYSPDGRMLASGSSDKTIRLWDVATGKELRQLQGHQRGIMSVVFSPDGRMLASGGDDETVRLWDVATGKELRQFQGHQKEVDAVAFSSDGRYLASGGWDHSARLWDVASGKELQQLRGHQRAIHAVALSPDGRMLISASCDATIGLWDVATSKQLRHLREHQLCVRAAAFSPDGRTFASGSVDKTIRLWDAASGKVIRQLLGHEEQVESVAFSPDGRRLASASYDKTIRIWDLTAKPGQ